MNNPEKRFIIKIFLNGMKTLVVMFIVSRFVFGTASPKIDQKSCQTNEVIYNPDLLVEEEQPGKKAAEKSGDPKSKPQENFEANPEDKLTFNYFLFRQKYDPNPDPDPEI
jgi:hypothetical protein